MEIAQLNYWPICRLSGTKAQLYVAHMISTICSRPPLDCVRVSNYYAPWPPSRRSRAWHQISLPDIPSFPRGAEDEARHIQPLGADLSRLKAFVRKHPKLMSVFQNRGERKPSRNPENRESVLKLDARGGENRCYLCLHLCLAIAEQRASRHAIATARVFPGARFVFLGCLPEGSNRIAPQCFDQRPSSGRNTTTTSNAMTNLDICLITSLHPSMNPRLVKEADALTGAGYRVGVIAPDFSEWGRIADREFQDRMWQIIERPRFGPLSPRFVRIAELGRRALAGFATRMLGWTHPAIVRAAWHPVTPALVAAAKRHRADLYIAHMVSSLSAAAIAASHHGARYAFDAEDFHAGDFPEHPQFAHQKKMGDCIERNYISGCAYVTAASPLIADAYCERYGIERPTVVLNTFPLVSGAWFAHPVGNGCTRAFSILVFANHWTRSGNRVRY